MTDAQSAAPAACAPSRMAATAKASLAKKRKGEGQEHYPLLTRGRLVHTAFPLRHTGRAIGSRRNESWGSHRTLSNLKAPEALFVGAKQQLERPVISRVLSSRTKCKRVCLIANTHLLRGQVGFRLQVSAEAFGSRPPNVECQNPMGAQTGACHRTWQPSAAAGVSGAFPIHSSDLRAPAGALTAPPAASQVGSIHLKEPRLVSLDSQRPRRRLHRHDCAYL
jgi:hypothetical protein